MIEIKRAYENINGDTVEKTFQFHLFKNEVTKLGFKMGQGLDVDASADPKEIAKEYAESRTIDESFDNLEDIVAMAYGFMDADGESFVKDPEATKKFRYSNAFADIIIDLLSDKEFLHKFMSGIMPKELGKKVEKYYADLDSDTQVPATTIPASDN